MKIDHWDTENDKLVRKFEFSDFRAAFNFVKVLADLAEAEGHHPEIYNSYNVVELRLCTHDAGHLITEKDQKMALAINKLL